jgi:hypothetical protein
MPSPLAAAEVLDREFLSARARLIDVAATLDRIDRAEGDVSADPRLGALRQAIQTLAENTPGRAEQLQLVFSLPYEDDWRRQYGIG